MLYAFASNPEARYVSARRNLSRRAIVFPMRAENMLYRRRRAVRARRHWLIGLDLLCNAVARRMTDGRPLVMRHKSVYAACRPWHRARGIV